MGNYRIAEGDIVNVIFTRNNLFEWQNSPTIRECRVLKTPNDTGDTYGFVRQDDPSIEFYINPNCADFVGLELIQRQESLKF